jgi:hypothetical protein
MPVSNKMDGEEMCKQRYRLNLIAFLPKIKEEQNTITDETITTRAIMI